ncbi:MAG: DUF2095 family protein [Thermogladius sp.]|jgi:hypothetical protein|nr:DUF2095 family protein [Thermogladius sp.]
MSIDEFRRRYPHLAREILESSNSGGLKLTVDKGFSDPWQGYLPNVSDYLRRCKSESEAYEVIEYLVKHGELSADEGEELKKTIREHGLRYFGERKMDDYYYKVAKSYWKSARKAST